MYKIFTQLQDNYREVNFQGKSIEVFFKKGVNRSELLFAENGCLTVLKTGYKIDFSFKKLYPNDKCSDVDSYKRDILEIINKFFLHWSSAYGRIPVEMVNVFDELLLDAGYYGKIIQPAKVLVHETKRPIENGFAVSIGGLVESSVYAVDLITDNFKAISFFSENKNRFRSEISGIPVYSDLRSFKINKDNTF